MLILFLALLILIERAHYIFSFLLADEQKHITTGPGLL